MFDKRFLPSRGLRVVSAARTVAVSQTEQLLKVMVANHTMIDACRAGGPGNGKPFPDGSRIAKIEW